jgi:diguanylate cyclase (GGDEF)-like protein
MRYSEAGHIKYKQSDDCDSSIMQNSIPIKMLIACLISCILGIVLMSITAHYHMMAVFICIIICVFITNLLVRARKISIEAACLAPILILCFVYTPMSWFTFDGLLGSTPYLSILFLTIIALTHYGRRQVPLISSYAVLMLGLTIHWFATWPGERYNIQTINIFVAYIITAVLIVGILESIKRKNLETNKLITDISIRDDLTGLLNRRGINQIFGKLENDFMKEGIEYAAAILDIDEFKGVNDIYGHNLGDAVLKKVAENIKKSIRSTDYAFRFGGDEFLLLMPNMDEVIVQRTFMRIEIALREIQDYDFMVTVSMGYALRSESSTIDELLELADRRMYRAKQS